MNKQFGSSRPRQSEHGYVIVTIAALLFVLLGFTALAIDVGLMYSGRTQLQEAADAAAMAGAFTFINNDTLPQPATAILTAQKTAMANKMLGAAIAAGELAVDVPWPPAVPGINRVTVTITKEQSTYFAKVMNANSATIRVRGMAESHDSPECDRCTRPFFIPNIIVSPPTRGSPHDQSVESCNYCATNQVLIDALGQVTTYGRGRIGQSFTLKPDSPGGNIAPGQSYLIEIGGTGGNDVRQNIAYCPNVAVMCQSFYSVKTGITNGPVKQGIDMLVGDPPTDIYVAPAQYRNRYDNIIRSTSRGLVTAPIWDSCSSTFCPSGNFPSGTGVSLKIIGFALIFIDGASPSGDITAHLIDVSPCGTTAPAGGCVSGAGAFGHPIRLVRP
jgi:Flp pilus assembly protein TadG